MEQIKKYKETCRAVFTWMRIGDWADISLLLGSAGRTNKLQELQII
jgi:hypothetical protein